MDAGRAYGEQQAVALELRAQLSEGVGLCGVDKRHRYLVPARIAELQLPPLSRYEADLSK
ncbi:hypothetical protein [Amycolatopsis taiwanensis]|uniref:Uncharacterized protein n=1 Tax=Amycolatopsis taiwanensis TaxID=342230 RepID=A0A9W6RBE2_9PSEU|nr:hypothetical protein [Amycolatopsis taiwanensis]GLY70870.1 hypothetical protein Atai01_74890 [Amycolatopsis taiwanensis]